MAKKKDKHVPPTPPAPKNVSMFSGKPVVEKPRDKHGKLIGGITGKGFMPGNNANPGGRPKGSLSITALLRKRLMEEPDKADEIVEAWIEHTKAGNIGHLKEILERLEGKVKDVIEHQGSSEYKVSFEHGCTTGKDSPPESLPEADAGDL